MAKTPAEALTNRLLTDDRIKAAIGNRLTPNIPDVQPKGPYVVYQRYSGGAESTSLEGCGSLHGFTYRFDVYGVSEEEGDRILTLIINRLCGNRKKSLPVYVDRAEGVQGCFPNSDKGTDVESDAAATVGQSVTIWFTPTE